MRLRLRADCQNGVGYIAQVLKRNRTLKVLNLADNKIDGAGLALLAEALKYNSTLETLDLSNNPCCGAHSEGIAALRTAFTVNTSLKRLFLADTGLTTDGAISLAEFLPESKSLLHLDVTNNPQIDTAGILAISVGLKANTLIRCLDISIPPNNPELAELSQNILQSCIRNTELAATSVSSKEGKTEGLWAPIKKSVLVRSVKQAEEARAEKERVDLVTSPEGQAREYVYTLPPAKIPSVAEHTIRDCEKWYEAGRIAAKARGNLVWEPGQLPKDDWTPLLQRARVLRERLEEVIVVTTDGEELEKLLQLNDGLTGVLENSKGFIPPPRLLLPSQIVQRPQPSTPTGPSGQGANGAPSSAPPKFLGRRHMRGHSLEIASPNFSIGDSDDSDAEELDVAALPASTSNSSLNGTLAGLGLGPNAGPSPQGGSGDSMDSRLAHRDVEELAEREAGLEEAASPIGEASRAWVEEEGEIFRKGTKLGVGEDDEDDKDVSGEQLKQEVSCAVTRARSSLVSLPIPLGLQITNVRSSILPWLEVLPAAG
jgi:protein phosphatase 1 regulatory subunit 37